MAGTQKVLFTEHLKPDGSFIGEIQLNRPESLNALDMDIVSAITAYLNKWQAKPNLSAVFLHGTGRSFCAGGDVKSIVSTIQTAKREKKDIKKTVQPFFASEYHLDYLLHNYPHPVLVWGHGVVMGGGVGLLLSGSHTILTEDISVSMPEAAIGFFTDVGSSYFLSRLESGVGWFLALTGYRCNDIETKQLFSGTSSEVTKHKKEFFCIHSLNKKTVLKQLISSSFETKQDLTNLLHNLEYNSNISSTTPENWLQNNKKEIYPLVQSQDVQVIFQNFKSKLFNKNDKFYKTRQAILSASPTSLAIICELLKRAESKNLKDVFQMDLTVATNIAIHSMDFIEGVRALLVDKTGHPQWQPNQLEQLNDKDIQKYFQT